MLPSVTSEASEHDDLAWCATYTRHQHEKVAAEMLSAKGIEVFLPVYRSVRQWKDRKKLLTLPLFPCYLFVRGAVSRRLEILTTPGVHSIVSRGDRVATIPDQEIDAIRKSVVALPLFVPPAYSGADCSGTCLDTGLSAGSSYGFFD